MLALGCAMVAALIAAVIGTLAQPIGRGLGLLDFPDGPGGRKLHAGVTPLVGGLALTLAVIAAVAAMVALEPGISVVVAHDVVWLAVIVTVMFLIGSADDRFDLSVRIRLAVATIILLIAVVTVPDFTIAFIRFGAAARLTLLGGWSIAFTLLCLVGLLNSVNMADGKNGVVIGQTLVWSAVLLARLPSTLTPVIAAAAAALAVLLVFNMRGRLFLGDGGSYAVSALFGLLAVYCYNHAFADIGADTIALLFAVPVFDTLRLVATRIARRRSPFAGGRDHLHHFLFARLGWPAGLVVYLALVAASNLGAMLTGHALAWLGVTFAAYIAVLIWAQRSLPTPVEGVEHAA